MKKILTIVFIILIGVTSCSKEDKQHNKEKELIVYCYDAFASEWGTGAAVIPEFEEQTGIKVKLVSCGDAVQMLNKVIAEKKNPSADVVIGLDNSLTEVAAIENLFISYKPEGLNNIAEDYIFDSDFRLIPYDYGFFAFVYNSEKISAPLSMKDLTDVSLNDKIIMMDPRTSSVGLGFLLWTISVYGDEWTQYWKDLSSNLLTVSDTWDRGYGLFTSGEAPVVLSYSTSPAYHVEYESETKYKAAIMSEGHYIQIEGAGIVKGCRNTKEAKKFMDFMLSDKFQNKIPLTNYMYPVSSTAELPESFQNLPRPEKFFALDAARVNKERNNWIKEWRKIVAE